MPSVQRVHETFKSNAVTVLAITIDGAGLKAAKPVVDADKLTLPVPIDQDMNTARKFAVRGVPMTYVVDRRGMIVAQGFGPMKLDAPEFHNFVRAVAAQ